MKKVLVVLLALISVSAVSFANPPKKLTLTYNEESHKLKVDALHPVKDVTDHYIYLISISVNGKEVKLLKPEKQSSQTDEIIEVKVPEIVKGCVVTVKASCNKFGSKTKKMTI